MSKFVLTAVLLVLLASFLHYSPPTSTTAARHDAKQETMVFPISEQIKLARMDRRISQDDLADKVGLSRMTIDKMEKGQVVPTHDLLLKMQDALKTPLTMDGY